MHGLLHRACDAFRGVHRQSVPDVLSQDLFRGRVQFIPLVRGVVEHSACTVEHEHDVRYGFQDGSIPGFAGPKRPFRAPPLHLDRRARCKQPECQLGSLWIHQTGAGS